MVTNETDEMLYSSIEKLSLGVFLVLLLWQAHPALMPQKVIKVHFHNILLLRFVTKKDEPIAALLLVLQQIMFSKKEIVTTYYDDYIV